MAYYLPTNRRSANWYTTRSRPLVGIVVHCTAGLEDVNGGPDQSAEATARYAATTDRAVSWHSGSDTDSVVYLLPSTYTAWHCVGYNSSTYGHEISKRTMDWSGMDAEWVTATLERAAEALRPVMAAHRIPARHASKAELDRAIAQGGPPVGLLAHADLDPSRRSDPGSGFPWDRFLALLGSTVDPPKPKPLPTVEVDVAALPMLRKGDVGKHVGVLQRNLKIADDQDFGPATDAAVREFQTKRDLTVDGVVGAATWSGLLRIKA